MAKVGKEAASYDPFKGGLGGKNYEALSSALDDLDTGKRPQGPVPRKEERRGGEAPSSESRPKTSKSRQPTPREVVAAPVPSQGVKRFAKRFQATRAEGAEYDAASLRLSAAVGSKIDFSKVTRTLWRVYLQHEEDVLRNVTDPEQFGHPGTGDAVGLALLEEEVVKLIGRGLILASRRRANLE